MSLLVLCECGCGQIVVGVVAKRFLHGHNQRGKKRTLESIEKFKLKVRGEKHHKYKEEGVGLHSLHTFMRSRIPKPERCKICNKAKPRDLANVGGYDRNVNHWVWLCRRCHNRYDHIMRKLNRLDSTK